MEEPVKSKFKLSVSGAIILGAALISLALVLGGVESNDLALLSGSKATVVVGSGNENENGVSDQRVDVDIEGEPFLGSEDAPITVVEFSDYQCPFCRMFFTDWLPRLKSEYIEKDLVRFVYKDYPIESIHPLAVGYASAANCAGDQDKYWEMHDKIFEEQAKFGQNTISHLTANDIKAWAVELGLDAGQFNNCFDTQKYADEINGDLQEGTSLVVRGTPTFFVNGRRVPGLLRDFSLFEAILQEELN